MSGTQSVGGVAIRTSPMEGAAKLAALLSGQSLQGQANDKSIQAALAQSQALRGMFADQPPAQSNAQMAMAAGAQQGSVGPTNANARVLSQLPPQQGMPSPYSLPGLTPQANMTSFMANTDQHMKELAEASAATPEMKNNRAMGYTPQMALAAKLAADAKAGEIERRGGNQYKNFLTGENGMVPKIPDYANPVGGIAANGALTGGVAPMPNALPIAAANAGAVQGAKSDNTVYTSVPGPGGAPQSGKGKDLFGGPQTAQAQIDAIQSQLAGMNPLDQIKAGQEIARLKAKLPGVVSGQTASDAAIAKTASDTIAAAPAAVQKSRSAVTGLENALQILESGKLTTGVGADKSVNVLALLNNAGIPLLQGDVNGFQTMNKYLQNSLNDAASGSTAGGSDARFESFMHGQPNGSSMNAKPLSSAIRYVLSQHDANIVRNESLPMAYSAAQKSGDPNAALTAQQVINAQIKPDYFAFNRMSPDEQQTFLKQKGAAARDFVAKYNKYAETTGWVK